MRKIEGFGIDLLKKNALLAIFWLFSLTTYASHNLGGEITIRSIGGNNYEVTLTTYTDPTAAGVDRCYATIEVWSAGSSPAFVAELEDIPRQNGPLNDQVFPSLTCDPGVRMGEYIFVTGTYNVKKNIYMDTVNLNPGVYTFFYSDMARYDNVVNIPNSGNTAFTVFNTIILNPFLTSNETVKFLNHAIDFACTDRIWTHNPGGYDVNGDSLAYSLIPCMTMAPGNNLPAPILGYEYPDFYGGVMTIDGETGLVTWDTPEQIGVYNISIKVVEFRNGLRVDSLIRDMAIYVFPCDNEPPVIEAATDTCVQAGDTLILNIKYYDPNFIEGDSVYCYLNNGGIGNNGPFSVPISPATITFNPPGSPPVSDNDTVYAQIRWITDCSHIRSQFYQVDLYAHDGYQHAEHMLSVHHVIKIRVKPGPLTGLVVTPFNRRFYLEWDPHDCPNVFGYEIYRSIGTSNWQQDSICCEMQPNQAGFELIGETTHHDSVTFVDDNQGLGFDYGTDICYVVVAVFPDGLRSCATDVICNQVEKDHAVLTQDSVDVTDALLGTILVSWSQPNKIDTAFFPQPYTYSILRKPGIFGPGNFVQIASGISFNDTTFTDAGLSTSAIGYRYRVDVYDANDELISEGNSGSSIFLGLTPGDHQMQLTWREFTPWVNSVYYIYRADGIALPFVLIDSVAGTGANQHTYLDLGLTNFQDYCYYVLSKGSYPNPDIKSPLLNASQKVCDQPRDFTPPCLAATDFDTSASCEALTILFTFLPMDSACAGDLDFYTIYRSDLEGGPWTAVATVDSGTANYFLSGLNSISDCYGITATDTNGNESQMVVFCFENCPEIETSNVFTPNGDGINDFFNVFNDRAVKVTYIHVYDRWGSIVYEQSNVPDIHRLWDGNTRNGKPAPEGVYYFVIEYDELRLMGDFPRPPLVGNVTLLR